MAWLCQSPGMENVGTATNLTTSELPEFYQSALMNLIKQSSEVANRPYDTTYKYDDARIAEFDPAQTRAFQDVSRLQGGWQPDLSRASSAYTTAGQQMPDVDLTRYMNPFQRAVTDVNLREMQRQHAITRGGISGEAVAGGAFGGSRHALAEAEAERNLQQNMADTMSKDAYANWAQAQQGFNADRAAALTSGSAFQNLGTARQTMGLQDAAALENVGRTQQQMDQSKKDLAYSDFMRQANYQPEQAQFLSSIIRGLPASSLTSTTQQQQTQAAGSSPIAQVGGAGLATLGVLGGTGAFGQNGWAKTLFAKGGSVKAKKNLDWKKYAEGGTVRYAEGSQGIPVTMEELYKKKLNKREPYAGLNTIIDRLPPWVLGPMDPRNIEGINELKGFPEVPTPNPSLPYDDMPSIARGAGEVDVEPGLPISSKTVGPYGGTRQGSLPQPPAIRPDNFAQDVPMEGPDIGTMPATQRSVDGSMTPQLTTTEETPKTGAGNFWDKASLPIAAAGFKMMEAERGKSPLQVAGGAGLEGIKTLQQQRKTDEEERRNRTLEDLKKNELKLSERKIASDELHQRATERLKEREHDINERLAANKITVGEAEAEQRRSMAEFYRTTKAADAEAKIREMEDRAETRRERLAQQDQTIKDRADATASAAHNRELQVAAELNMGQPLSTEQRFNVDLKAAKRFGNTNYGKQLKDNLKSETLTMRELLIDNAKKKYKGKQLDETLSKIEQATQLRLKQIGE